MPKMVCAAPCFSGGNASSRIALAGRLQSAAGQSLQHAEGDQRVQARRHAAQRGGEREDGDRQQKIISPAQPRAEPAGDRQDDRVGGEVAGDDPFAVGDRRRQSAGDVAQGDVGDGGVQHLHEGGDHDGDRDQPGIDRPARAACGFDRHRRSWLRLRRRSVGSACVGR